MAADGVPRIGLAKSIASIAVADSHDLPWFLVWGITFVIPFVVAMTNFGMVWFDTQLVTWKFFAVQYVIAEGGVVAGAIVLALFAALLSCMASTLVMTVAPICAGSGLPEAKGYYNGNYVPGLFKVRGFCTRVVGIVLATAAGFPIGREGPMVCIGGSLGFGVSHLFAKPYHQEMVHVGKNDEGHPLEATIMEEDRFTYTKRVGCVLGAAAGIAVAFNAPIGGILYMLEEVTVTSWAPELTFRVFACTCCAVFGSRLLLDLSNTEVHKLLIYVDGFQGDREWQWFDVPFFVLLAAAGGLASACFTKVLSTVWSERKQRMPWSAQWKPYCKVGECVLYAVLCAMFFALAPAWLDCINPVNGPDIVHSHVLDAQELAGNGHGEHSRRLNEAGVSGEEHSLSYVQYDCGEGGYNEAATLLLSTSEGAIKHLFSRNSREFSLRSLVVVLLVYGTLAMGMPGLPVPMGCFVPCMLIGALLGRVLGEALARYDMPLADPGVYAMVGTAAMLGGFTHMTIAIAVLLVEGAHDLSLLSPLMLSIFVARLVSKAVSHTAYDEILIEKKEIPFLEAEFPEHMDKMNVTARQVCDLLPDEVQLPSDAPVSLVRNALSNAKQVVDFPVIQDGACVGLTTRTRLQAALSVYDESYVSERGRSSASEPKATEMDVIGTFNCRVFADTMVASELSTYAVIKKLCRDDLAQAHGCADARIPVHRIMDPAPYFLLEDMPVQRFYPLFAQGGVSVACVISNKGRFRGVLSRASLAPFVQRHDHRKRSGQLAVAEAVTVTEDDHDDWYDDPFLVGPKSNREVLRRQTHQLPVYVIGTVMVGISTAVSLVNYAMVWLDVHLVSFKFDVGQQAFIEGNALLGALWMVTICACYAGVASLIVSCVAPACAGSGIPEAKGYLNGNAMPSIFKVRMFCVRTLCIVFSTASGFPIGREGPMVCIGGTIGYGVAHCLAIPYYRSWVLDHATGAGLSVSTLIAIEEKFADAKRIGYVLGAAAGISVAFNAPIGGILYLFEEVTVTCWSPELTFRAFFCTVLAVMISRGLLNLTGVDVHRLVIWENTPVRDIQWSWVDVPFFVVLAAGAGLLSALLTKGFLAVWTVRRARAERLKQWQPYAQIADVMAYAALCALVFSLVPLFTSCISPPDGSAAHRLLTAAGASHHANGTQEAVVHDGANLFPGASHGGTHANGGTHADAHEQKAHLVFQQYTCPEGSYNEVATLILTTAETAVKHLFARNRYLTRISDLLVAIIFYGILAVGMPGLLVPMGSFVPNLLIGALLGRTVGQVLSHIDVGVAHPGIYALVGSASMLGGFTHMTLAIVVLLIEACYDLTLVAPLMLGIFTSRFFSKLINKHGYDEVLILKKGVPVLDAEALGEVEAKATAADVCNELPEDALLPVAPTDDDIGRALALEEVLDFPVVRDGICIGLITRTRLQAAREQVDNQNSLNRVASFSEKLHPRRMREKLAVFQRQTKNESDSLAQPHMGEPHLKAEDAELKVHELVQDVCKCAGTVPLHKIMDPAPFTLLANMPVRRFHILFTKVRASAAFVMKKDGSFCGVVTRRNLISASRAALMEHENHHGSAGTDDHAASGQDKATCDLGPTESAGADDLADSLKEVNAVGGDDTALNLHDIDCSDVTGDLHQQPERREDPQARVNDESSQRELQPRSRWKSFFFVVGACNVPSCLGGSPSPRSRQRRTSTDPPICVGRREVEPDDKR